MRSITAEDVIRHMEVPETRGLYVLGCFEGRVTLLSQQVRALNLVYALRETKRIQDGSRVLVVGGGAAGMTIATAAARLGCSVTLLEKKGQLLSLFRGNHTRWLHPHIYDWPQDDALSNDARLPLLSWRAALAGDVALQLEEEWNRLPERSRIKVIFNVQSVDLGSVAGSIRRVSWNAPGRDTGSFEVVVLAVGFGFEQRVEGIAWASYWDDDRLHQAHRDGRRHRHLISGCGDGGLVDLLRVRLSDFRHEKLVEEFLGSPELGTVKRELLAIEDKALALQHTQGDGSAAEFLEEQYRALCVPAEVDKVIEKRLRPDTEAVLNGLDESPLTPNACIFNRFLVSRLLLQFGVGYRAGKFSFKREGEKYLVKFRTGAPEEFDYITCRHGPKPGALEEGFAHVWDKCIPLRARSELDQTRWPIWRDDFFNPPPSSGGTSSAAGRSEPVRHGSSVVKPELAGIHLFLGEAGLRDASATVSLVGCISINNPQRVGGQVEELRQKIINDPFALREEKERLRRNGFNATLDDSETRLKFLELLTESDFDAHIYYAEKDVLGASYEQRILKLLEVAAFSRLRARRLRVISVSSRHEHVKNLVASSLARIKREDGVEIETPELHVFRTQTAPCLVLADYVCDIVLRRLQGISTPAIAKREFDRLFPRKVRLLLDVSSSIAYTRNNLLP